MRLEGASIRPGLERTDCSQGKLILVCETRVSRLSSGLREVSINVVRKETPVPPVLTVTQVVGNGTSAGTQ
jgi:hypothetical protein